MARFSELKVKFTGDSTDLQRELRRVNAVLAETANSVQKSTIGFSRLASSMQSVGQSLSIGITAPLVGFGAAALKMAGQMEQASVAFNTMLKSGTQASKMLEDLKNFAATTPFQFPELTDAARRMMALGFSAKEVIPTLRVIGDAAGALGLGAEGIQRITLALGQMRAKGTVQAEEMRQLAEAGIPAWDALAKKLGVDVATAMKLVEQRSVSAAVGVDAALTAMRDNFGGGMAAEAKTLLGLWSNVRDQVTFALADIGSALAPTAKRMIEDFIRPSIEGVKSMTLAFAQLPTAIQTVTISIAGLVAAAGPLSFVIGGAVAGVLSMVNAAKVTYAALASFAVVLANVAGGITTYLTGLTAATAGTVAFSVATAGIAAAVAVGAAAIWRMSDAYLGLRDAQQQQREAEDTESKARQRTIESLKAQGAYLDNFVAAWKSGAISTKEFDAILREFALSLAGATKESIALDSAAKELGFKTTKQLNQELKQAKENLSIVAIAFQQGKASAEDLANAQARVQQISAQLHPTVKQLAVAMGELSGAMQGPKTEAQTLADAIAEIDHAIDLEKIERFNALLEQGWRLKRGVGGAQQAAVDAMRPSSISTPTFLPGGLNEALSTSDQKRAAQQAEQGLKNLRIQYGYVLKDAKESFSGQAKVMREVSTVITDMSRGIADAIVNGRKLGDVFKSVAKEIATALIREVIQGAFAKLSKVIIDSIGQLSGLGKVFSAIFGGGSSSGGGLAGLSATAITGISDAAKIGGSIAGTAGKVAGSAVTGIVGAVAGVVSAVSSVISNFQLSRQETSLNAIEWNTRKTSLHAQDTLLKINEGIPGFTAVQQRIVEVRDVLIGWDQYIKGGLAVSGGGGVGGVTINMTGSWIGFRDMDAFVDDLVRRINARK